MPFDWRLWILIVVETRRGVWLDWSASICKFFNSFLAVRSQQPSAAAHQISCRCIDNGLLTDGYEIWAESKLDEGYDWTAQHPYATFSTQFWQLEVNHCQLQHVKLAVGALMIACWLTVMNSGRSRDSTRGIIGLLTIHMKLFQLSFDG